MYAAEYAESAEEEDEEKGGVSSSQWVESSGEAKNDGKVDIRVG